MKNQLLLNSLSGGAFFFVSLVLAFVMSPIIVNHLGNDAYGAWEILLSVQSYLLLLDLGIVPAIVRFVARASAQDDEVRLNQILTSTLIFLTLVGLLGFLVMGAVALFPDRILNLDSQHISGVRLAAVLLGFNLLVQFPAQVFVSFLMGLQRHYFLNGIRIVLVATTAVLTWQALTTPWSGPGIVWLALFAAGATFIESLAELIWLRIKEKRMAIGKRFVSRETMHELNTFGLKSMLLMAAYRIQNQSVPIVIGWVLGAGQVPFFAIPNKLIEYSLGFTWAIGFPLSSHFSHLEGKGDMVGMRESWYTTTRCLQFVLIGMAIAVLALGESFLQRWMGAEYAAGGRWVIRFLGASLLIESLAPNSSRMLVAMDKHGFVARLVLIIALASFPVTILLARSHGIPGVAFSVLLAKTVSSLTMFVLASRALGISRWTHFRRTLLPFLVPTIVALAVFAGLRLIQPPASYPAMLGEGGIAAATYLAFVWLIVLTPVERRQIGASIASQLARFRPTPTGPQGGV